MNRFVIILLALSLLCSVGVEARRKQRLRAVVAGGHVGYHFGATKQSTTPPATTPPATEDIRAGLMLELYAENLDTNNLRWRDTSGGNNDATASSADAMPTASNSFVLFDGINDLMSVNWSSAVGSITSHAPNTIFICLKYWGDESQGTLPALIDGTNPSGRFLIYKNSSPQWYFNIGEAVPSSRPNDLIDEDCWAIHSNGYLYYSSNGTTDTKVVKSLVDKAITPTMSIGGNPTGNPGFFAKGHIYAIRVYRGVSFTDEQIHQIRAFLKQKYGV